MVKPRFEGEIECPWCHEKVKVTVKRETVVPAEPAEYKEEIIVEKAVQSTLDEQEQEE